jgi:hypothetical protein
MREAPPKIRDAPRDDLFSILVPRARPSVTDRRLAGAILVSKTALNALS